MFLYIKINYYDKVSLTEETIICFENLQIVFEIIKLILSNIIK